MIEMMAKAIGAELFGLCEPDKTPNNWASSMNAARAAVAAIEAAGYRIVPVEPTMDMRAAGAKAMYPSVRFTGTSWDVYSAMLAAALRMTE